MKDNFFQLDLKPFFGLFQVPKNLILDIWSITKKMSLFFLQTKDFLKTIFPKELNDQWDELKRARAASTGKSRRYKSLDSFASKKLLQDLAKNPTR